MVFNEEKKAVDWIFRYGNEALAILEKLPLDKLRYISEGNHLAKSVVVSVKTNSIK